METKTFETLKQELDNLFHKFFEDMKIDEKTGEIKVYARKNIVEEVNNKEEEISLTDAQKMKFQIYVIKK